ncbi:thioredoxin [Auricularia subglabra TFB-10046 SS5]|uniref:Thioredoxin n=1 Tax=Auricularia subglabra (strain TFB-10046 / SS5) TaxID=717982 RepID=J0WU13_AURST|nr:thioredoxin [Auricularia subglabra TFB-10046 SS5]
MGVEEVKGIQRFREIIGRDEYSVFDFWAEWCGPCRIMAPIYEKLSNEHGAHVKFYKVDNDAEEDIVTELGIRGLPSFLLFKNGQQVGSVLGARPPMLQELVAKAAADAAAAGKPAEAAPAPSA